MNSATLGPLRALDGYSGNIIDVNLHRSSIFFFPSQKFSLVILCRKASRKKISWGNYITGPRIESYRWRVVIEEIFHCKCIDG